MYRSKQARKNLPLASDILWLGSPALQNELRSSPNLQQPAVLRESARERASVCFPVMMPPCGQTSDCTQTHAAMFFPPALGFSDSAVEWFSSPWPLPCPYPVGPSQPARQSGGQWRPRPGLCLLLRASSSDSACRLLCAHRKGQTALHWGRFPSSPYCVMLCSRLLAVPLYSPA